MLTVAHNIQAMNAQRQFNIVNKSKVSSTEKLSSGYKINRAADDAAGLAISEKMRRQIRGLNQGAFNIQDGISLCQTADGALDEVDGLLQRVNELAVQAANGTNTDEDREYIQLEIDQIMDDIDRIGKETTFNDIHIFDIEEIEKQVGKVTQLASSPSADAGRLAEAYKVGSVYYPSASVDFSGFRPSEAKQLNNAYFEFNCSNRCSEAFKFILKNDGTESHFDPKTLGRTDTHVCYVDIRGCNTGEDIVNRICSIAGSVKPVSVDSATSSVASHIGGVPVSHTNVLKANGSVLNLIGTGRGSFYNEEQAKDVFKGEKYGKVDCSTLTSIYVPEPIYTFAMQCSSELGDKEYVHTRAMNATYIGARPLDVTNEYEAGHTIEKVKNAFRYIANMRSNLGAEQNRLEHAYNSNTNAAENTTAAESGIRDTDMAKEMVSYSLKNILSQAGQSIMAQANQSNQMVLSLLQ